ncbi:MAG: hypothetical protein ACRBN8_45350 [Nannocystales bacterium]
MHRDTIVAVLAGLSAAGTLSGCRSGQATPSTEVPSPTVQESAAAEEHSCGNHAEGACGGEVSEQPTAALATERNFEVAVGKFAELNMTLRKGATVRVVFSSAGGAVTWNVHSHAHGGGTNIHDEGSSRDGTIEFTAPDDGVFSVLWKNDAEAATPLEVAVELGEGASVHSWMPE